MRKYVFGLGALIVPALLGASLSAGCTDENGDPTNPLGDTAEALCGPCGVVASGDVGISGNAKLDGFFQAVNSLNGAIVSINGDFEANIDALIGTFGTTVAANATLQAKVDALSASIEADIGANASGGLVVNYAPPRCQANVSVAVEAQAKCEVKGGCTGDIDPGSVNVTCQGKCEGSCSAGCTGGFKCDVAASGECGGSCEGSCTFEAAAACDGTCRGTCTGACSAYDGQGNCAGQCDGNCNGSCEFNAAAECNGSCSGKCVVTVQADCQGRPVECSGSCTGECGGSCQGSATPPSAHVECDATAECQAQARAQASASVECSPPSFEVGYAFNASANAEARVAFSARMAQLKLRGAAILQGFARYEALISGEVNGEAVFAPAPLALVRTELQGVVTAGVNGSLFAEIPPFRATCALAGLNESVRLLGTVATQGTAGIAVQADFVGVLLGST